MSFPAGISHRNSLHHKIMINVLGGVTFQGPINIWSLGGCEIGDDDKDGEEVIKTRLVGICLCVDVCLHVLHCVRVYTCVFVHVCARPSV